MAQNSEIPPLTEEEARKILYDFFNQDLRPDESIWIGKTFYSGPTGYSFEGNIFSKNKPRPTVWPIWGVNAIDRSVCPYLA